MGGAAFRIRALGAGDAGVIGHDWGANVAWNVAKMRPDLVRGVVGLSVPPLPRGVTPPLATLRKVHGGQHYWNHIEEPGVADAEYDRDPVTSLRRTFYGAAGDNPANGVPRELLVPEGGGLLDAFDPHGGQTMPGWLTGEDLQIFAAQFAHGFTGPLNCYRNIDRNWELGAAFDGLRLKMPAHFIAGGRDRAAAPGIREIVERLPDRHDRFHEPVFLPDCGHWTQQERPDTVTRILLGFLASLEQ